jgi:uncharacterized membrane protein
MSDEPERPGPIARGRRYLVAGLLLWIPVFVTVFVLRFLVDLMDTTLLLLPDAWHPDRVLGFHIPGLGFLLALTVLGVTGLTLSNLAGRRLVLWWEGLMQRIPVVRSIYSGAKTFAETVFSGKGQAFKRVLLIEYPRKGIWSIGFQSAEQVAEIDHRLDDDMVCVFVPTTPNPTSGFIMMVPRRDCIMLDMSIDQAMKMIVTLGVVVPVWQPPQQLPLAIDGKQEPPMRGS